MDFDLDALPELDADGKPVGQEVDLDALPELDADGKPVEEQKKSLGIFGTLGAQTDAKAGRKVGTVEAIAENTPVVGQIMDAEYNRQWNNLKRLYEGDFGDAIEATKLARSLGFSDEDMKRINEEAGYGGRNLLGNYTKFDMEKGKALFKELVAPEFAKRLAAREAAEQKLAENDLNWAQKGIVGGVGATKLLGSMANAPLAAATLGIDATNRAAEQLAGKWILDENGQPTKIWWKTDANGEPVRDEAGNLVPREELSQDMAMLKGFAGAATERFIWMGLGKVASLGFGKAAGALEKTAAGAKVSEVLAKATSGTMKGVQEATEWLGKTSAGRAVLNVGKAIGWLNSKGKFGSIPDMMVKSRIQEFADQVVGLSVADPAEREEFTQWLGKFVSVKENAELFTEMLAMHLAMKAGGTSLNFAGRGLEKIGLKEAREFDRKSAIGRRVEETVAELVGEERAAKLTDKDLVNLYRIVTSDGFTAERAEQFAEKVAGDVDEAQKLIDEGASLSSLAEGLKARRQYSDQFVEGAKAAAAELRDRVTLDGAQSAKINDAALKAAEGNVEIAAKVAALAKSRLTNKHTQVDDAEGLETLVAEAMRPFAPEARSVKIHDMKGNRNVGEQLTALEELGIGSVEDAELNGVVRRDENGHLTGGARQAVNIATHGTDALKSAVKDGSIDAETAEALITAAHTELGAEATEARAAFIDGILERAKGDAALARRMAEIVGEGNNLTQRRGVAESAELDAIAERAKASIELEEAQPDRLKDIVGCRLSSIEGGMLGCSRFRSMSAQFGESTDENGNTTKKLSVKGLGEGLLAKPGNWADGAVLLSELQRVAEKNGAVLDFGSVETATEAAGLLAKVEREGLEKAKAKLETRAKLVDVLARSSLDTGVTWDEANFRKALAETSNGRQFIDNHGNIYGLKSADGTLHFNPLALDYNIPIHEYGHLALEAMKGVNRRLWERGMELVKESDYYRSIKEQSETEGHEYGYLKGNDAGICDEALAHLIGDNGEKLIEAQGVGAELKAWLQDFWKAFKGAFGLADMTEAQIEKLTLGEFVDAVNAELLRGKDFGERKATPLREKSIRNYDEADGSGSNGMLRWKNDRGRLFYIPVDMERTQPGGKVVLATDNANITDWIQGRLNGYTLRMSKKGNIYVEGRDGLEGELAEIFGRYPKAGMNDGIGEELASVLHNDSLREATPDQLVEMLAKDRANYDEWVKATRDGKTSLEDAQIEQHYADEAAREAAEARQRWEDSGMDVPEYILSRIEDGDPGIDLDWETMREIAHDEAEAKFAVGGIFTGSSADYANRSREGGKDDGPSIKKIGSGEGSQVYGWGLYGSTVRGIAEKYSGIVSVGSAAEMIAAKHRALYGKEDAIRILEDRLADKREDYILSERQRGYHEEAVRLLREGGLPSQHIYEQTFFTDRAPGDESHLLKWYDAISDANWDRVIAQAEKEGLREKLKGAWWLHFNGDLEHFITDNGNSGDAIYERLSKLLGGPQTASEFLARAGIDGVKYPVDSYGGKGVKDGDKAGWNYVSFRDDNIRVDHKWTDGVAKFAVGKVDGKDMAVIVHEPMSKADTKNEKKVKDYLVENLVGREYRQAGEEKLVKVAPALAKEYWGGSYSSKIRDRFEKLWQAKVGAASVMEDIVGTTPLGGAEAPKSTGKRQSFKKGATFYRCKTTFGALTTDDKVAKYPCELVLLELANGKRFVYDIVNIRNPTLAHDSPKGEALETLKAQTSARSRTTDSSIAQTGAGAQGGERSFNGVTPEQDAAYAEAVKRGDLETARRMEREVYERMGYSDDSSYQGTSAFNGAAPSRNAYFETKAERIEAAKNGEMEDTTTLGDYRDGIDLNNLQFIVFDPRSERNADAKRQEAIRNIRGVLDSGAKTIKMYRSVPADVKEGQFRNGDWITPSRAYAEENARIHGWEKSRIIEQDVSIEDVWWDGNDIAEWGFDDGKGSVYKNTLANRKLLGPTYDDAGNLIPLSKRFNDWKNDVRFAAAGGQVVGDWIIGADGTIARRGTPQASMIGGTRVADDAGRGEQTPGSMAAALERLNAPRTTMKTIGTVRPTSLPISEMEFLRKYLTGDHLPAKIAKKIAGGKIAAHTKAGRLTIAADVFGLVDKTDVAPAKDRLKEHGFFRNEDEAWAANHSEVEVRQERERSEAQLGDDLLKLADRRARGVEAGGESAARGVYANELAKIVMDMPRKESGVIGRVQKIGDAVRSTVKEMMTEKGAGNAKDAMADEARRFLDWARGGAEPEGAAEKTDREIADEMFASWLVMPEEMGKLAPTWSEAILRTVAETPELAEAFKELSYRALSKDSHKAVFEAVRKSQTLAVEKALKELEADRTEKISAGSRIADAKEKIIVTFHDTMGAVAVRIDEKTRQYLAARRKVLADMKARGATKGEIAAVENEIDLFTQKIGHLKNRLELSRTAMERGTWNEGRRYMLQYLLLENKATKKWGLSEEDKSAYLDMMRIVETQGRAASYGMDPRQARLALGDMARRLGTEKWARLEEYGREFFSVMEREFLNDPRVERMWGKGMVDYLRTQAHYVTTKRVQSAEELDAIETVRAKARAAGVNGGDDVIGAMFTYAGPRGGASALGLNESAWKAKLTGSMGAKQEVRSATWEKQQMLMQSARRNQFILDLRDALLEAKVEGVRDVERGEKDVKAGSRYGTINYVENGVRRTLIVPKQIAEGMKATPDNMPWLTKFHNAARGLMIDWNVAYWNRNVMRNSGSIEKNMPGMHETWLKTVLRVAPGMAPTVDLACQHLARHSKGAAKAMGALFGRDTIFPYIQQAGRMAKLLEDPTAWQERLWDAEARGDAAEVAEMHEDLRQTMEMLKGNMFLPNKAAYGNRETQGFANDMMNKAGFRMVAQMQQQAARTRLGRAVDLVKSPFKRNERQQEYEDVLAKSIAFLHDRAVYGAERSSEESGLMVKRNVSIAEGERKGSESRTIQRYMTQFFNMTEKGVTRTVRAMRERPGETLGKMARTWVGRFVGGAITYGLVTRAIRALYGDDEEKAKASPLGEVYGFAKWIENANKNLSNYVRNHYQTIPLWVSDDGYTTIVLGTPLNDEDSLIAPSADFAAKAFANAMGSKNDLALGQMLADTFIKPVTPDLAIATPALKVIRDTVLATLVENPTDLFTGAPTYDQDLYALRNESWEARGDFALAMARQVWNDVGARGLVAWDRQGVDNGTGAAPKWIGLALKRIPVLSPVLNSFVKVQVGSPEKDAKPVRADEQRLQHVRNYLSRKLMLESSEKGGALNQMDPQRYAELLEQWQGEYGLSDHDMRLVEKRFLNGWTEHENEDAHRRKVINSTLRKARRMGIDEADKLMIRGDL